MKDTDKPIPMFVDDGTDEKDSKGRKKAYGCISHFDSAEGSVTATCRFKKPTADCTVNFKGYRDGKILSSRRLWWVSGSDDCTGTAAELLKGYTGILKGIR